MCVLRLSGEVSFSNYAAVTPLPVVYCDEKGEPRRSRPKLLAKDHGIAFRVSDIEWDDIQGQIEEAIQFLVLWEAELVELLNSHKPVRAFLDFPLYSRLDGNVINQNEHFPSTLIRIAGKIGLGIALGLYDKAAFDQFGK